MDSLSMAIAADWQVVRGKWILRTPSAHPPRRRMRLIAGDKSRDRLISWHYPQDTRTLGSHDTTLFIWVMGIYIPTYSYFKGEIFTSTLTHIKACLIVHPPQFDCARRADILRVRRGWAYIVAERLVILLVAELTELTAADSLPGARQRQN